VNENYFRYVSAEDLERELDYLTGKGYVESTQQGQRKLSVKGIEKTQSLYKNFVEYIKTHNVKDSAIWVSHFDSFKWDIRELIEKIFFNIEKDPELKKNFRVYLDSIGNMEFS
jgi:hypothetical protein